MFFGHHLLPGFLRKAILNILDIHQCIKLDKKKKKTHHARTHNQFPTPTIPGKKLQNTWLADGHMGNRKNARREINPHELNLIPR